MSGILQRLRLERVTRRYAAWDGVCREGGAVRQQKCVFADRRSSTVAGSIEAQCVRAAMSDNRDLEMRLRRNKPMIDWRRRCAGVLARPSCVAGRRGVVQRERWLLLLQRDACSHARQMTLAWNVHDLHLLAQPHSNRARNTEAHC